METPMPLDTDTAAARRTIHISGYERESRDFYATPPEVTEALLGLIRFRGSVWEPCCGNGAMSSVFQARGYDVHSTDLVDRGFGTPGVDFLQCDTVPAGCRSIVTNPPYGDSGSHIGQSRSPSAMLNFLRHSLTLTESVNGQLALLVRLQWLAGQRVADVVSAAPCAAVIVLTKRIKWFDMGDRTNSAQHHHAWIVFDYERDRGQPPVMLYA